MRGIRIRWPIVAVSLLGFALVAALLSWQFLGAGPRETAAATSAGRTNLLVLGRADDEAGGGLTDAVIASLKASEEAVFLAIPGALAVKESGGRLLTLEDAFETGGADAVRTALGETLGIELEDALVCDDEAFVRLVDAVGGLTVRVEADISFRGADGAVEIRAGDQTLGGREALAFVRGDSAEAASIRLQRLVRAVVERGFIGKDATSVRQLVRSIEALLESDLSLGVLTDIAYDLARVDEASLRVIALPSDEADRDGSVIYELRAVETERLVATLVRGLALLTPNEVQVAVFNGNGERLMASRTAEYLRARGFEVTRTANAESFDYPTSYIVVLTDEAKAWILRDALPAAVSIVFPDAFGYHYDALVGLVPFGTDLLLIAGAGMEIE
jgi:LCP family protein required for cell wall assembly